MHVAVRHGGLHMTEVVGRTGGKYQAAAQAVKRFEQSLAEKWDRPDFGTKLKRQLSII